MAAAAQELPLPPGAVIAVHIRRPAALTGLASELKIPGSPAVGKLSALTYAMYPGDKAMLVLDGETPEVLDRLEPLVRWVAKKSYSTRVGNRMIVAPDPAFIRPGLESSPLYQEAKRASAPDVTAWAFVNMA